MSETTAARQATSTWKIDPAHTDIEFAVKHMMITTVKGRFSEVSGTIVIDDENPERSTVEAEIGAASIDTREEQRDAHLRSADFLDVEKHPTLVFRSKRVEMEENGRFRLVGELTIRGVSEEVTLEGREEGRTGDPWGGQRIGFTAKTTIDRRRYGLEWNQLLEAGGLLVGNDVRISIDVQAVLEESEEGSEQEGAGA